MTTSQIQQTTTDNQQISPQIMSLDDALQVISQIHPFGVNSSPPFHFTFYQNISNETKKSQFRQAKLIKPPEEIAKEQKEKAKENSTEADKEKHEKDNERNENDNDNDDDEDEPIKEKRTPVKWTQEETEFLLNGYRKYSNSWTQILKEYPLHPIRIRFDLKDKWRNLHKKTSDPNIQQVFDNIEKIIDQRTQNLSKVAPFFILVTDTQPHVQKIRAQISEIFPKRFHQKIFNLLEDADSRKAILEEWPHVEEDPSKAYDFINRFIK